MLRASDEKRSFHAWHLRLAGLMTDPANLVNNFTRLTYSAEARLGFEGVKRSLVEWRRML